MKDDKSSGTTIILLCLGLLAILVFCGADSHYFTATQSSDGIIGSNQYSYSYQVTYIVQEGDSLCGIIEKYQRQGKMVDKQTLVAINKLSLYYDELGNEWCDIHPGMELLIPIE